MFEGDGGGDGFVRFVIGSDKSCFRVIVVEFWSF